jgi:protein-S-isoprenylcysteine O-methyltransferase Ste14
MILIWSWVPVERCGLGASRETSLTAIKTLIWSILVPGTLTVLVPYWLLSASTTAFPQQVAGLKLLGIALISLGFVIYVWCAWDFTFVGEGTPAPFDPPKRLVVKGPYRFVRNPMYVFVALALIGESIFFATTTPIIYAGVALLFFHLWVVYYEEPTLRRKFGESYERYSRRVSRWLPGMPPHDEAAET